MEVCRSIVVLNMSTRDMTSHCVYVSKSYTQIHSNLLLNYLFHYNYAMRHLFNVNKCLWDERYSFLYKDQND